MKRPPAVMVLSLVLCGAAAWTGDWLGRGGCRALQHSATMPAVPPVQSGEPAAGGDPQRRPGVAQ
jgi:hypothetical protein